MIFKKPYAFLIKNFKIIHIFLLAIIVYTTYRFSVLVDFFSSYTTNSNLVSETAASSYVSPIMIFAVLLIILFSASMWLLMNNKRKPSIFYLLTVIYYGILLFSLFHAHSLIETLVNTTLTQQVSRAYSDIYKILFIPNIYFIIITFIRAIGFDVKKFNFNKDLQELEIKSEDNEEFEFVLGNDNFKYQRRFRRFLREFKYYLVENKLFITIIITSLLLICGALIFLNVTFFNHVYVVGETFKASNITYTLNHAYLTKKDYNGNTINNNKTYLILDFTINSNSSSSSIKPENFYLKDGKKVYNYSTSMAGSFFDLGIAYSNNKIDKTKTDYIFIFEIEGSAKKNYSLNIFDKISYKNNNAEYEFKTYKIVPISIDNEQKDTAATLKEKININEAYFPNTSVIINSYKIVNYYTYKYDVCNEDKSSCVSESKTIIPDSLNDSNLLVIEYQLSLDEKTTRLFKPEQQFFNKYLKVESSINNNTFNLSSYYNVSNAKNIVIYEIPKSVKASQISFNLKTRDETIKIGQ